MVEKHSNVPGIGHPFCGTIMAVPAGLSRIQTRYRHSSTRKYLVSAYVIDRSCSTL